MSLAQARQAAIKLQQDLVELDPNLDVELEIISVACFMEILHTAVLKIDGDMIFISETGAIWSNSARMRLNSTSKTFNAFSPNWNAELMAKIIKDSLSSDQTKAIKDRLLSKFKIPIKKGP